MTVGAVSSLQYNSNYNYDTTSQYKYFGFVVSDERLQQLMAQYGIIQTGDSQTDLDALYQAMYPNATSEATKAATSGQNAQKAEATKQPKPAETAGSIAYTPWANLMGQVGLIATGDLSTDYTSFSDKLTSMQASATTTDQKASIWLLQAEASIAFVAPEETTKSAAASTTTSQQPQAQSQPTVTGADIQAQLNRLFLVL